MLARTTRAPGPSLPALPALVVAPVQDRLGDYEERHERRLALNEEVNTKLEALGPAGITKPKELLNFMDNVTYKTVGGQQLECDCSFCGFHIVSTGSSRVVPHVIDCLLAPSVVKVFCKTLVAKTNLKRKGKSEHLALVTEEKEVDLRELKIQKQELRQLSIKSGFKSAETSNADQAIAKFFYANGLNFGAADCKAGSYFREMITAIQLAPLAYLPPNPIRLAGPLLLETHAKMEADLAGRDVAFELSRKFGVSYSSDGWDSCDNLPLINSCYMLANDGGVFQRSVDTSGFTKNGEYCASLMIDDIYSIGCTKVVLVVTDTCGVMRKCWGIVEDEFPWISCVPCQTHCPSLLINDICKLHTPAQVIRDETLVVGWFTNHHKPLGILRKKVADTMGKSCELKKAGATRMGTNTWVGERLLELKPCLQQTVVDPAYVGENYRDLPADVQYAAGDKVAREHKGGTAKKFVLDDDDSGGFWARLKSHVSITMPLCKFLRRHDSSAPAVGKVYHGWFEMGEHLASDTAPYAADAAQKHEERWVYSHSPFFADAYVLDPEFLDHGHTSNEEVMQGFFDTVEKIAILLKVRSNAEEPGEKYSQSWAARHTAIKSDPLAQKNGMIFRPTRTRAIQRCALSAVRTTVSLPCTSLGKVSLLAHGLWILRKPCLLTYGGTRMAVVHPSSRRWLGWCLHNQHRLQFVSESTRSSNS